MYKTILNYQWLIFDADNTLFDYDKAEKLALLKTLNDFNIAYPKEEIIDIYHELNHKIWADFEKGLIKSQTEIKLKRTRQLFEILQAKGNIEQFADAYLVNLSKNGHLLESAMKVIQCLAKTHQMVIMTNGMTNVQKPRFKGSPITQYFQHIVISEEIKHSKPSTEIFDHAFKLMRHPQKHKVMMIGDNLGSDIQGGINYGIDSTWFNPKGHKVKHMATYEVRDLLEFINF